MPSIDLPRVRAQAQRLAGLLEQPEVFLSELRETLDEHTERASRPGRVVIGELKWRSRGTPERVMRALSAGIRPEARVRLAASLRLLPLMWATGYREERVLAAEALGEIAPLAPYPALDLLSAWAPTLDSPETADALGASGLGPLLLVDPAPHYHLLRRWLGQDSRYTRRFAVTALLPLAEDRAFQRVQEVFEILSDTMTQSDMDIRRATVQVLQALAAKSPVETARYLREWAAKGDRNAVWVVRKAMAALDAEQQDEIRSLLRPAG